MNDDLLRRIKDACKPRVTRTEIDGFGELYLRSMTAGEALSVHSLGNEPDAMRKISGRIVYLSVCDEGGNRVFEDEEEALQLPPNVVTAILDHAKEINQITIEDDGETEGK